MMDLSPKEKARYGRQLIMPEIGIEGQKRLRSARVLVVGAGGLGSPALLYLAAAGVGHLGIADRDLVEESNLHRQVLHGTPQVGLSKVRSAKERLLALNPEIQIDLHETFITASNALEILTSYDVIVDGSDNFQTRYLLNDACVFLKKTLVYGSVFRFEGQVTVFNAETGPCYRCLYPEPPPPGLVPNCAESGVLGVLPGIIGSLQCNEAIKAILGIGTLLTGKLLTFDALSMEFRNLRYQKSPDCPVCSKNATIKTLIDYDAFCGVKMNLEDPNSMTPSQLKAKWDNQEDILLVDVREPFEFEIANLGGKLIPLGEITQRFNELDPERAMVMMCHHGVRSARAAGFLKSQGFTNVKNLSGGIDRWSLEVDPKIPRY